MKRQPNSTFTSVVFLALISLSACGPIYETQYVFTPPKSADGRTCTVQCDNVKFQCEQMERMREDTCNERARRDQEACKWRLALSGEKEHWYDCTLESCTADIERCEGQYRNCYQACGGKVESQTVCTANCSQAAPQR